MLDLLYVIMVSCHCESDVVTRSRCHGCDVSRESAHSHVFTPGVSDTDCWVSRPAQPGQDSLVPEWSSAAPSPAQSKESVSLPAPLRPDTVRAKTWRPGAPWESGTMVPTYSPVKTHTHSLTVSTLAAKAVAVLWSQSQLGNTFLFSGPLTASAWHTESRDTETIHDMANIINNQGKCNCLMLRR